MGMEDKNITSMEVAHSISAGFMHASLALDSTAKIYYNFGSEVPKFENMANDLHSAKAA